MTGSELTLDQLKDAAGGVGGASGPGGTTFPKDNDRSSGILTGDGFDT